jgi:hypothetical protein
VVLIKCGSQVKCLCSEMISLNVNISIVYMTHSLAELALAANLQQKQLSSYCAVENLHEALGIICIICVVAYCQVPLPDLYIKATSQTSCGSRTTQLERTPVLGTESDAWTRLFLCGCTAASWSIQTAPCTSLIGFRPQSRERTLISNEPKCPSNLDEFWQFVQQ